MDVRIKTRLAGDCMQKPQMKMIQIGTTPCFTFDLSKQVFKLKDISQLSFLFKQGCMEPLCFNMYDESSEREIDERFAYDKLLNIIRFTMKSEDTLNFVPTKSCGSLADFEIIVKVNGVQEFIFSDEDSKLFIMDSIYRNVIEV